MRPNALTLRIQPQEGIDVHFDVKEPGAGLNMRPAKLTFDYESFFGVPSPEAYQRLLQDAVAGDQSLFIRSDEVEECWRWTDSLKSVLSKVDMMTPGGWGPGLFRCEGG